MPATSGYSDRELVMKLQNGSQTAFEGIFNRYREKLLFYSLAIVKTDGAGKDIVQETFIRLWTNRQKLDSGKSLSGYLHTIARNLALNHIKRAGYDRELKEQIWRSIEDAQQWIAAEEDLFARESTRLVQEAVDKLPPQRRLIFQLSREKRMTHKEIAIRLGISKNTVKNQMVSALKEIRAYLKRYTDVALCWLTALMNLWF